MKKTFLLFCLLAYFMGMLAQSPMKPKVMIVPEEAYCINNGLNKTDAQGNVIPDYEAALCDDNLLDVINTFENLMAGYGFELTNLKEALNSLNEEEGLDAVLKSKEGGFVIEDDLDKISRVAGADILVKISPKISNYGPERMLELRVSSIDCASKKALQSFGPIAKNSAGSVSMLLKAAVTDNIESFAGGLSRYFETMKTKGREGSLIVKISETCPLNLESDVEYNGERGELADLIAMWVEEHAVGGAYTGGKTSPVSMKLDQVRIPLQGKVSFGRVKALSMEGFVKTGLTSLLSNYGISVSTHAVGIGKVYLTLGKL